MGLYRFRVLPEDSEEPVELSFASDAEALADARRALSDLLRDAVAEGATVSKRIEVSREDGSIVGLI